MLTCHLSKPIASGTATKSSSFWKNNFEKPCLVRATEIRNKAPNEHEAINRPNDFLTTNKEKQTCVAKKIMHQILATFWLRQLCFGFFSFCGELHPELKNFRGFRLRFYIVVSRLNSPTNYETNQTLACLNFQFVQIHGPTSQNQTVIDAKKFHFKVNDTRKFSRMK